MTGLVEFIEARLADDEQSARAAVLELSGEPWHEVASNVWEWAGLKAGATVGHVARHDPARVLREVAAKRQLLWYVRAELADDETDESARWQLQIMAAVWSDHPDYLPEWSPENVVPSA